MWSGISLVANTEKSMSTFWDVQDVLWAAEILLLEPMEEELAWGWTVTKILRVHTSVFLQMNMKLIKTMNEWISLYIHMYCSSLWLMKEPTIESVFLTISLDLVGQHDNAVKQRTEGDFSWSRAWILNWKTLIIVFDKECWDNRIFL